VLETRMGLTSLATIAKKLETRGARFTAGKPGASTSASPRSLPGRIAATASLPKHDC